MKMINNVQTGRSYLVIDKVDHSFWDSVIV